MLGRGGHDEAATAAATAAAANEVRQALASMGACKVRVHVLQRGAPAPPLSPALQQQAQQVQLAAGLAAVMLPDVECVLDSAAAEALRELSKRFVYREGESIGPSAAEAAIGDAGQGGDGVPLRVGILLATDAMLLQGGHGGVARRWQGHARRLRGQRGDLGGRRAQGKGAGAIEAGDAGCDGQGVAGPPPPPLQQQRRQQQQRGVMHTRPARKVVQAALALTAEARLASALLAMQEAWDVVAVVGVQEWGALGATGEAAQGPVGQGIEGLAGARGGRRGSKPGSEGGGGGGRGGRKEGDRGELRRALLVKRMGFVGV